jgi:RNA polymerase subunit RPABC4/transcription elongation factor Spt4
MTLDPTFLSSMILVLTGFAVAFLAALWVALVIWTYRDVRTRVRDRFVHILAAVLVALLNLPGLIVYLVLRPPQTLDEEYQQTLEEEALLQSIEEHTNCPGCDRHVGDGWVVCPTCQTRLRKACHECGKLMELSWNICPFCSTPIPGLRKDNATLDEAVSSLKVEVEKEE